MALIILYFLVMGLPDPPRAVELELDPAVGEWVEVAPPEPGSPEGELAAARQQLAAGDTAKSRKAFEKWLNSYGEQHPYGREARLGLAESLVGEREYYKAHLQCRELTAELATDDISVRAAEVHFVVAEVFLSGTKRKWLGIRFLSGEDVALEILDDITQKFENLPLGEYAIKTKADYYFEKGEFLLSEDEYGRLLATYSQSRYTEWANLRRAQAALARFPGTAFGDGPLDEADYRFRAFRKQHPQAADEQDVDLILDEIRNRRATKEFEVGAYYEKVQQVDAALYYYRAIVKRWPGTTGAVQAAEALERLGEPAEQL